MKQVRQQDTNSSYTLLGGYRYASELHFYRATRMHSADYAVARCVTVRPSVRPSHAGIVCKRLHTSSQFFFTTGYRTILVFPYKRDGNIPTGRPPQRRCRKQEGYEKSRFATNIGLYLDLNWCKIEPWKANRKQHPRFWMVLIWMTCSDLFQSHDYWTPNNSKMVQHRAILTMADQSPIERRHFQWPWTTHIPSFKVSLMLNISETVRDTDIVAMKN